MDEKLLRVRGRLIRVNPHVTGCRISARPPSPHPRLRCMPETPHGLGPGRQAHSMKRTRTRMAVLFFVTGLSIYVASSAYLMTQGKSASDAFRHVSIFYVPFLLAAGVCAVAAWRSSSD